ncbi:MAG: trypsin-like peptidase domain-containing protein [Myxococcota bacterium]
MPSTGCSREAEAADGAESSADPSESAAVAAAAAALLDPAHYDPRQSLAPMIKAVGPAVVAVDARGRRAGPGILGADRPVQGMGSGFIIDAEGLVVTNHHVIDGASQVQVRLSDGRRFDAQVVGSDPATDLALLDLSDGLSDADALPAVTLGQSKTLEVGDWVVALGNPMGLDHSATVGIISGKGRGSLGLYRDSYIDFLQTDADIAPGSSGGPLFNLRGEVVGINTAVGSGLRPGFAIPVDQARQIVEQLRDRGEVVRGWLGAGNVPGATEPGATIGSVYEGTPAERAGLRSGDVVEALDGEPLESFEALRARVGTKQPGDEVTLLVRRDGEVLELRVTLGARPESSSLEALRSSRGSKRSTRSPHSPSFRLPFGLGDPSEEPEEPPKPPGAPAEGPRLGVSARETPGGLEVVEVRPGSLAQTMGIEPGDRLRALDGQALRRPSDVADALTGAGSSLELRFERDGATHVVTLDSWRDRWRDH